MLYSLLHYKYSLSFIHFTVWNEAGGEGIDNFLPRKRWPHLREGLNGGFTVYMSNYNPSNLFARARLV